MLPLAFVIAPLLNAAAIFFNKGLSLAPVSDGMILSTTTPVYTMLFAKLFLNKGDDVLWTYLLGGWLFCMSGTCLVALLPGQSDQENGVVGGRASDRLVGVLWFVVSSVIFAVFSVVLRYDTTKVPESGDHAENPQAGTRNRRRRRAGWYNHRGWGFDSSSVRRVVLSVSSSVWRVSSLLWRVSSLVWRV